MQGRNLSPFSNFIAQLRTTTTCQQRPQIWVLKVAHRCDCTHIGLSLFLLLLQTKFDNLLLRSCNTPLLHSSLIEKKFDEKNLTDWHLVLKRKQNNFFLKWFLIENLFSIRFWRVSQLWHFIRVLVLDYDQGSRTQICFRPIFSNRPNVSWKKKLFLGHNIAKKQ